jgi:hypothetical protein
MAAAPHSRIALRWTIGDVSERGFEALRYSLWGAWHIFGPTAAYVVCVNTVSPEQVRARTEPVPDGVEWHDATGELPAFLARAFGAGMAEGVAWKLAPLRLFPDRHEIALDNDCVLWSLPPTLAVWLAANDARGCLMSEDVRPSHGQFAPQCPAQGVNSGIRGLPPGFDLAEVLRDAIAVRQGNTGAAPPVLRSELDEQGLQAAALSLAAPLRLVRLAEVSVCSPFHPHLPWLGKCGAHFVGLNARHIAWDYYERPADAWMTEHWERHAPLLQERTGAPSPLALVD